MPDTHINAYFAEVEEKHQKVLDAHADWETAKLRLEAKKKEVGYKESEDTEEEESAEEEPEAPKESKPGFFNKKK